MFPIVSAAANDAILNDCDTLIRLARELEDLSADPYVVLSIRKFVRAVLREM